MPDRVQPGARIDESLWQEFREEVEAKCGGSRGHLRNELERALLEYIESGDNNSVEINKRLERIEDAVGAVPTDGGSIASEAENTHTDESSNDTLEDRPRAKASRDKKRRWLCQRVEQEWGDSPEQLSRSDLIELVKDEYQFRSDTTKSYIDGIVDHFGLVSHPNTDAVLVTEETRREMLEEQADEVLDD
jgi:hypothetical protein